MGKWFDTIQELHQRRLDGKINNIPWILPRLTDYYQFPGWIKGKYYAITANTSAGKTLQAKYFGLFSTYLSWLKSNKCFDFRVIWIALEEPEDDFWMSLLRMQVYIRTKGKISISSRKVKGQTSAVMTEEEIKLLAEAEQSPFFKTMQEKVTFITSSEIGSNPTGIHKFVMKYMNNPEIGEFIKTPENNIIGYRYKNPELYVLGFLDHIRLMSEEKNHMGIPMSKHQTLGFFSGAYVLNKYCRVCNIAWTNIHQQAAEAEEKNLYRGNIVEDTLFPSIDNLGNNKEINKKIVITAQSLNRDKRKKSERIIPYQL